MTVMVDDLNKDEKLILHNMVLMCPSGNITDLFIYFFGALWII